MKPNVRMLVATDLGVAGDLALAAATTWARRHDGGGVVLHVGDASRAGELAARTARVAGDLTSRFERRVEPGHGQRADRILAVARELSADVIVLGGHDEAQARWRFGSVAERVVSHSTIPVLVARAHAATGRVIAMSDLSEASLVAVAPAREIARAAGTRPTVVHCIEAPQLSEAAYAGFAVDPEVAEREARRQARTQLARLVGDDADVEIVEGSLVPALIAAAEAHNVEVVVTASRCRTGLSRFLLGSVAGALVRELHRSVLVIQRA